RPFDPASRGWRKTEYRQGDVQDRASVHDAVKGADVVVHLAFTVIQASAASHAVNVEGSRNVFEAAVESGAERICYASSVAACGRLTLGDVADALDWYSFPLPDAAVDATAEVVARLPGLPAEVSWLQAGRKPVWMRTTRAQKELGWKPKHTARATLKQMIEAYREEGDHVSD